MWEKVSTIEGKTKVLDNTQKDFEPSANAGGFLYYEVSSIIRMYFVNVYFERRENEIEK